MQLPKPSTEIVERFRAAVDGIEGLEVRKMFGMPSAFFNGNMTVGVYGESIMLRLSEPDRAARLAQGWSPFEPAPGRTMREYVQVPAGEADDVETLRGLIERAVAFVSTLPPKEPKDPKKPKERTRRAPRRR